MPFKIEKPTRKEYEMLLRIAKRIGYSGVASGLATLTELEAYDYLERGGKAVAEHYLRATRGLDKIANQLSPQ